MYIGIVLVKSSQGGLVVSRCGCRTYDRMVVGSISDRNTIRWLQLGWI